MNVLHITLTEILRQGEFSLSWEGHDMIFPIIRGKHPPQETREQG